MRLLRTISGIAAALGLALAVTASQAEQQGELMRGDIVETAKASGEFTILVDALQKTGLDKELEREGPYTIFAPTDAAFKQLGQKKLDDLMKPENKDTLAALLKHHVISGRKTSDELKGKKSQVAALDRQRLSVDGTQRPVKVEDAKVTKADIRASNGVIHEVDTVIMPE